MAVKLYAPHGVELELEWTGLYNQGKMVSAYELT